MQAWLIQDVSEWYVFFVVVSDFLDTLLFLNATAAYVMFWYMVLSVLKL